MRNLLSICLRIQSNSISYEIIMQLMTQDPHLCLTNDLFAIHNTLYTSGIANFFPPSIACKYVSEIPTISPLQTTFTLRYDLLNWTLLFYSKFRATLFTCGIGLRYPDPQHQEEEAFNEAFFVERISKLDSFQLWSVLSKSVPQQMFQVEHLLPTETVTTSNWYLL